MLFLQAICRFELEQLRRTLSPAAVHSCEPDAHHPHRRRFTETYKAKLRRVKQVWIVTLSGWLLIPAPPFWAASGLFSTMLAFAILDETP